MGTAASTSSRKAPQAMVSVMHEHAVVKTKDFELLEQKTTGTIAKMRVLAEEDHTESQQFEKLFNDMSGALQTKMKEIEVAEGQMAAQQRKMEAALLDAKQGMIDARNEKRQLERQKNQTKTNLARANEEQSCNDKNIRSNEQRISSLRREAEHKQKQHKEQAIGGLLIGAALAPLTGGASLAIAAAGVGGVAYINHKEFEEFEEKLDGLKRRRNSLDAAHTQLQRELRQLEADFDKTQDELRAKERDYNRCAKTTATFGRLTTSIKKTKADLQKVLTSANVLVTETSLDEWHDAAELGVETFDQNADLLLTGLKKTRNDLRGITSQLKQLVNC